MSAQIGFDFGTSPVSSFREHSPGTWIDQEFTYSQYVDKLEKAGVALLTLAGPAQPLFAQGIEAAKAALSAMEQCGLPDDGEAFALQFWRVKFKPMPEQTAAFVAHCADMPLPPPGIEYKYRRETWLTTAAMFVEQIGTLIAHVRSENDISIEFKPWCADIMLESYRDTLTSHALPYRIWGVTYCADKLAYAGKGIASVPTFAFAGREYLIDGITHSREYTEGEGWTFCPIEDWTGPTYSYEAQCRAWDDGRLERGDRRGLVVSVRGKRCVLDGAALFHDEHADYSLTWPTDKADELPEDDFEAGPELDHEEEADEIAA